MGGPEDNGAAPTPVTGQQVQMNTLIPSGEQITCAMMIIGCASGRTYIQGPMLDGGKMLNLNLCLSMIAGGLDVLREKLPAQDTSGIVAVSALPPNLRSC